MRHGSLFSGIGGFDLAATWMGWDNVFQCEKEEFCQRILRFYWPNARLYGDVREFDATGYRGAIEVLSGGFPCQSFSIAGRRKGTADDRYLWPEMCRIVNEVRPRWVVGENVFGLLNWSRGMVFEQVQADLEAAGYEVWSYILPAAGIGAPHRRERVWIVAYAGGDGCGGFSEIRKFNDSRVSERMAERHDAQRLPDGGLAAYSYGNIGPEGWMHASEFQTAKVHAGALYPRSNWGAWKDFPAEPPVCVGDDGLSTGLDGIAFSAWRYQSLRGAGNAVVPGVVMQIFRAIERMEKIGL